MKTRTRKIWCCKHRHLRSPPEGKKVQLFFSIRKNIGCKSSLVQEIDGLKSLVSSLETEKSGLVDELAETNDRLEQLVLEIDTLIESREAVQGELDHVKSKLAEADSEIQKMKDLSDERATRLAENVTKLEKENGILKAQIAAAAATSLTARILHGQLDGQL